MIARIRRSLGATILMLAALNLILLLAIGLAASGVRVPRSLTQMVMQSAEPRLQDVARRIALDLERVSRADADAVIDRYADDYDTRFMLVLNDGTRIAGARLPIPDAVKHILAGPREPPDGSAAELPFRPRGGPVGRQGPGPPRDRLGPPDARSGLRMPQTPAHLVRSTTDPQSWIVVRTPVRFAESDAIVPGSLLVAPYRLVGDPLLLPLRGLLWVLLALGVTVLCWWPLLSGLTKGLRQMEHATSEIAQGRFHTTLASRRSDEVGRLAASIEQMAARLSVMISGQKRFLGDTAHELRSPIGRMQVALEILDRRIDGSDRAYVNDLREDVGELSRLTDELLQFARADMTDRGLALTAVPILPIVERVTAREGDGAALTTSVEPQAVVKGDAALIERALSNVVRNAVKYAGHAGPIHVSTQCGQDQVILSVADQGPGVSIESLPRLFEPFFREDGARNRSTGGAGLGLAIVRSAIEACGGTVGCRNREPHGLEVTITLPRG
jgi:two-component system, OmpR family, sensor histidine kinase CpxA